MYIPNKDEFLKGIKEYRKYEKRDSMYKVATFLVSHFWGKFTDMSDGLGVILLTWNQAFYRYGPLDFDKLELFLKDNFSDIESFRKRDIFSYNINDKDKIKKLFYKLLTATSININGSEPKTSPVSVAKCLHILCSEFFPLWDTEIAKRYGYNYSVNPAAKYLDFSNDLKQLAIEVRKYKGYPLDRSIIKLIDEYNYSKYTKRWI